MRWTFLLVALVACSGDARSPAPPPQRAPVHRFQIGALAAAALRDGEITVANDGKTFGLGHTPEEVGALLTARGLASDSLQMSIQPLLVRDGARVLLFDTGAADAPFARAGHLPEALRAAEVAPEAVTDVFLSHGHPDHTGGLVTRAGTSAFPRARIHVAAPAWEAMRADAESAKLVATIAAQVDAFAPDAALVPGVTAVEVRGHTPGHTAFRIVSGAESLLYLGDTAHHVVISVERPGWPVVFDVDRATAATSRQALLTQAATAHERLYAVHFPFPGLGKVEPQGTSLVWRAEQ